MTARQAERKASRQPFIVWPRRRFHALCAFLGGGGRLSAAPGSKRIRDPLITSRPLPPSPAPQDVREECSKHGKVLEVVLHKPPLGPPAPSKDALPGTSTPPLGAMAPPQPTTPTSAAAAQAARPPTALDDSGERQHLHMGKLCKVRPRGVPRVRAPWNVGRV